MKLYEIERRLRLIEALLCDIFHSFIDYEKPLTLREIEQRAIRNALARNNFIQKKAARELGITERVMSYKMRGYQHGRAKRKVTHNDAR